VEYVDKVVAAVSAWRVTPGGRPLIDRRRRSRAQRNGRGVIDHLNKVCGVPLGPHGVGEILMRAPQILLIKIPYYDTWNVRMVELAAFMHLHGHCNVPEVSPRLTSFCLRVNRTELESVALSRPLGEEAESGFGERRIDRGTRADRQRSGIPI